jgi:hypothetical protein
LSVERNADLATAPVEELSLPFLQPDQVKDSLHAYQLSKGGNSLRLKSPRKGKAKWRPSGKPGANEVPE